MKTRCFIHSPLSQNMYQTYTHTHQTSIQIWWTELLPDSYHRQNIITLFANAIEQSSPPLSCWIVCNLLRTEWRAVTYCWHTTTNTGSFWYKFWVLYIYRATQGIGHPNLKSSFLLSHLVDSNKIRNSKHYHHFLFKICTLCQTISSNATMHYWGRVKKEIRQLHSP